MAEEDATNGTAWRIRSLEHRVNRLESSKPDVIADRVDNHARELAGIRDEMISLKHALYGFALSITVSAVGFALIVAFRING